MGDKNALNDLLFVPTLVIHLQLCHTIARRAALPPFKHSRCIFVCAEALDTHSLEDWALGEGDELDVVVGLAKVEYTETLKTTLVGRRLDHAVDRRFVVSAGKELHHVAGVDNLRIDSVSWTRETLGTENSQVRCQYGESSATCHPDRGFAVPR